MAIADTFINKTISHFHILEKLGEGGMGRVYKAVDTRLQRTVALKFLSPALLTNDRALAQFRREAIAASAINHPNICSIYDIDESESQHFIIMENIDGPTLRAELNAHGHLSEWEAVWVMEQICPPLLQAHEAGIVHRDLKPDNFIIDKNLHLLKITDFGMAKLAAESISPLDLTGLNAPLSLSTNSAFTPDLAVTTLSGIMGTAAYMSPEQVRNEAVDHRADIFAIGAILFELLSGLKLFSASTQIEVLEQIAQFTDVKPVAQKAGIPDRWIPILNSCLQNNPDQRYQSLHDVLNDIAKLKQRIRPANARLGTDGYKVSSTLRRVLKWSLLPASLIIVFALSFIGSKQWIRHFSPPSAQKIILPDSIDVTTNSAEAYYYFSKGRQLWWRYANRNAIENLQIAVEIDTAFSYAYCLLGLLLNWQDRGADARICFQKSLNNLPNLTEWEKMLVSGFQYYIQKQPELMLAQFDELVRLYPKFIDGYAGAMLACERLDYYDRAIEYGKKLLQVDSTNIAAHNNLADLYSWKRDYQSGLYYAEKQLDLVIKSGDLQGIESAYEYVGKFHHLLGHNEKAEDNFYKALEYDPQNHDAAEYLAEALILEGKADEAERVFQAAVSSPMQMQSKATLYWRLANLFVLTGRYAKALETLEKSRDINQELPDGTGVLLTTLFIYQIYFELGQHRLAENDFSFLKERMPADYILQESVEYAVVEFYLALESHEIQHAQAMFETHLKTVSAKGTNIRQIQLLLAAGQVNEALPLLSRRIQEDTIAARGGRLLENYLMAKILVEKKEYGKALEYCHSALKTRRVLQHYNSLVFINSMVLLGEIYEKLNEADKAAVAFARFLDLWEKADPATPLLVQVQERKKRIEQAKTQSL